jgi:ubiquinone/menaquinone biosynthesis C-methylase UbiE
VGTGSISTMDDDEYVLGTHDSENARLELQHRVWRDAACEAWRRAGIAAGQTVIDLGCGPGFATRDLADLVGATGRVIALDKSSRYLRDVARAARRQVEPHLCDLDSDELPVTSADAAWARWVFCFLARPRDLLARLARVVRPGGVLVAHEYLDYRTWRALPRSRELEEFVAAVMASWRAAGGEPDIALDLVPWLHELGFEIASTRPILDVVTAADPRWRWLTRFAEVGLARLVELGHVTPARAEEIAASWPARGEPPDVRMVTPAVLEIIARRRDRRA